jgi:hypothetical protein
LNDTGDFKYKHPVIIHFNIRSELEAMLTSNPELFLEEYANTRENVKRYRSYLNNKKRSKEQRERDEKNLRKHAVKENLMKDILGDR